MKRSIQMCGAVALCIAVTACSNVPSSRERTSEPVTPEPEAAATAPEIVPELADNQDLGQRPPDAPPGARRENLTCSAGSEDRHARIGVQLVNDEVIYFAYYSKWRPRTCSLEAGRGDAHSRWTDNGTSSTVTLADRKGELRIERNGGAYRFAFVDVDRVRYCGMRGKINGSLTVTRGRSSCVVEGVMDGHAPGRASRQEWDQVSQAAEGSKSLP